MFTGLTKFLSNGFRFFRTPGSSTYVGIRGPQSSDPTSSFYITLFNELPSSTKNLSITPTGIIELTDPSGGGSVTSVALAAPSFLEVTGSPVTSSGTLTLALADQAANTFFAGPASGAATGPTFRGLVWADVSSLAGTSGTSFAVGNDSRFHTQGTDTGTTATSFNIDSGGTGVKLKNSSGTLQLRNLADTAFSDLEVNNLVVRGTNTEIQSETLIIADNIIVLNSNVTTGTPTENAGISVSRGSSAAAINQWNEEFDRWYSTSPGGSALPQAFVVKGTFTNSSLTAGVLTFNHDIGERYVSVSIIDNNHKVIIPDDITCTNTSTVTVDLTSYGTLSGTWRIIVVG